MTDVRQSLTVEGGVLVGHDESESAQAALVWAAELGRRAALAVNVVRAWSMVTAPRPRT